MISFSAAPAPTSFTGRLAVTPSRAAMETTVCSAATTVT